MHANVDASPTTMRTKKNPDLNACVCACCEPTPVNQQNPDSEVQTMTVSDVLNIRGIERSTV